MEKAHIGTEVVHDDIAKQHPVVNIVIIWANIQGLSDFRSCYS
jgi:hypothetical protein